LWRLLLLHDDPHVWNYQQQTTGIINPKVSEYLSQNVAWPSVDEQRRIAEVLDTADATIQQTEALIAKLKQMKAGLLHDLLTRGLDEQGQLRDPVEQPEQFKDTLLGRLPKNWDVHTFQAMKPLGRPYIKTGPFGSTLKGEHWTEEGIPVITIGALGEGEFIKSELLFISEAKARSLAAYAVEPGDLVFSRVADVGRSVVVGEAEANWIMSSNLMRISLDQSLVVPSFAHLILVYSESTRQQVRRSVNAGGREIANTAILNSLQFAWPSRDEQERIVKVVAAHNARIHAEEAYRDKLKLLKKGLMDDLLTGRVRVNALEEVAV
jgi:type I restriction enzyme S subunit